MVQPFKYIIVDDDDLDRLAIEVEAGKYPFLRQTASCSHPLEAIELIHRFQPDIVFSDIEMPGTNGIDLIKQLTGQVPITVFITSHPEFAMAGYETEVFDYILKPLDTQRFNRCAMRLLDFCELKAKAFAFDKESGVDTMVIKQGHDKIKISVSDIFYLEAMKDYTRIISGSGQFLVLGTLSGMTEKLPSGKFVQIHRSYVINREKVSAVKGNKIMMSTHEVPVGKLYKRIANDLL